MKLYAIKKPDGTYWSTWRDKIVWTTAGGAKNAVNVGSLEKNPLTGWFEEIKWKEREAEGWRVVEVELTEVKP